MSLQNYKMYVILLVSYSNSFYNSKILIVYRL